MGLAGATLLLGCPTPPIVADPTVPSGKDAFSEQAKINCSAVRPQTEPDLMAWDPASRANLSRLRQQGPVVVRYEAKGCDVSLEVLPNCIGASELKYQFEPYAEKQSKVAKNDAELYAQLPLGAARLSGKLAGEKALKTDYRLVGTAALPAGRRYKMSELRGSGCERATHIVSVVYLGGFNMYLADKRAIETGASVFSFQAGFKQDQAGERLDEAGDAAACETAAKEGKASAQCQVPLRVGVTPIDDAPSANAANTVVTPPAPEATRPSAARVYCAQSGSIGLCFQNLNECEEYRRDKMSVDKSAACKTSATFYCYSKTKREARNAGAAGLLAQSPMPRKRVQCMPTRELCEGYRSLANIGSGAEVSACEGPHAAWPEP